MRLHSKYSSVSLCVRVKAVERGFPSSSSEAVWGGQQVGRRDFGYSAKTFQRWGLPLCFSGRCHRGENKLSWLCVVSESTESDTLSFLLFLSPHPLLWQVHKQTAPFLFSGILKIVLAFMGWNTFKQQVLHQNAVSKLLLCWGGDVKQLTFTAYQRLNCSALSL